MLPLNVFNYQTQWSSQVGFFSLRTQAFPLLYFYVMKKPRTQTNQPGRGQWILSLGYRVMVDVFEMQEVLVVSFST